MFESLLHVMQANNVISDSKIKLVFYGAAAVIDEAEALDDQQRDAQKQMRETIEKTASSFGIEIPPPGQVPMQRKH